MTTYGIDLSHWNAVSSWSPTGLGFVIIKASEGTTADALYGSHMAKAKSAGLFRGAYCFARNDVNIDAQAKFFVDHAVGADFLAVDNEGAHAMTTTQTKALIAGIRKYDTLGRKVILYMSESGFYTSVGQDDNWVANWSRTPHIPYLIWQYLSGSQSGSGGEDRNRYEGTLAQLKAELAPIPIAPESDIAVNSYPVPKVPTEIQVATGDTLWPNDTCDPNDPARVIVSPGRYMPFLGTSAGGSGRDIVAFTNESGVPQGKSMFAPHGSLGVTRAIVLDDGYTKATQDAAVAAQKAADAAAIKTANDATAAAQAEAAAAEANYQAALVAQQAAVDEANKAKAELAGAADTERARIAAAEAARIEAI